MRKLWPNKLMNRNEKKKRVTRMGINRQYGFIDVYLFHRVYCFCLNYAHTEHCYACKSSSISRDLYRNKL